jgi:aerobic-type carbon monoxide dehydrogenase small subunit (CoxS/CutS family)
MSQLPLSQKISVAVTVNGVQRAADCEYRTTLGDFLRHELGLTGTHYGCEHGVCGACTIHLNDEPVRSCLMFAYQANGKELKTVEGLSSDKELTDLQAAFKKHHALQCGFCTPGFLMTSAKFLIDNPNPTETQVREAISGNICRCTGYKGIVEAILDVAYQRRKLGA